MNRWDCRFLGLANHIAQWSKDPSTRVGAVIADREQRIVSVGYNGFPRWVDDSDDRLSDRNTRLAMTLHAEENALLFASRQLKGCTIYVFPMPPCSRCAGKIIQVGITRVVAQRPEKEQRERWAESFALAEDMYKEAGVKYEEVL